MAMLSPEAADSLLSLESDTDGLVYTDMWMDATTSLLTRRTRPGFPSPGYSSHNFGMAVDLDISTILKDKMIRYEDLLHIMKKRGWVCFRRDGLEGRSGSGHFDYLGSMPGKYLTSSTQDPATWLNPGEALIWEKYGSEFQIDIAKLQTLLSQIGFYHGPVTGQNDPYTREAIMAFQKAWDLIQNGFADTATCRALVFITAELQITKTP